MGVKLNGLYSICRPLQYQLQLGSVPVAKRGPGSYLKGSMPLPIHAIREQLEATLLDHGRLVLTAPTGSGKSTQVPQFVVDDLLPEGRVLVLQPRRLAARLLATRVAHERDQQPGGEVGYITRFEKAVCDATRILYVTDGVLLRMLQGDPELRDVSVIIFDEFHERALNAELGLGLARHLQASRRPDLKLLIMSATLDAKATAEYLETTAILEVGGRQYPVETSYQRPKDAREAVWDQAARALRALCQSGAEGDVLIFMPGSYEIRRTIDACKNAKTPDRLVCLPLYSNLSAAQQQAAMEPVQGRKIIVATNIAETSLTIDGVRHVIDSGLQRLNRYDAGRGFNTLHIEPISKYSADQRAGRAGRQAPGTCTRLWSKQQQLSRPAATDPEIQRVDLAQAVLQLKALGFADLDAFPWLEPPPDLALDAARTLLASLGALDRQTGELTALGRQLIEFPMHPRLARLLLEADERGCVQEAAMAAALISEAPIYRTAKGGFKRLRAALDDDERHGLLSDFFPLLAALDFAHRVKFSRDACESKGIMGNAARQVWRTRDVYLAQARRHGLHTKGKGHGAHLIKCLLVAFPEHLALRRDKGTLVCDLPDGRRGELVRESCLRQAELFLAGEIREIGGGGRTAKVLLSLASEVRKEWLDELFPEAWELVDEAVWDEKRKVVEQRHEVRCLGLTLEESHTQEVDPGAATQILADLVIKGKLQLRGWDDEVDRWITRVRWLAEQFPDRGLITYDDTDRALIIHDICTGERAYSGIRTKACLPYVQNALSWEDQEFVRQMAPEKIKLPSGWGMRIDYTSGQQPKGKARIQDLYDLEETPSIAGGRVPLLLEIQAPNMRAVQITDDLGRFWRELYPQIKKELSRRYHKHEWR